MSSDSESHSEGISLWLRTSRAGFLEEGTVQLDSESREDQVPERG